MKFPGVTSGFCFTLDRITLRLANQPISSFLQQGLRIGKHWLLH
jgi:hypothetical protein